MKERPTTIASVAIARSRVAVWPRIHSISYQLRRHDIPKKWKKSRKKQHVVERDKTHKIDNEAIGCLRPHRPHSTYTYTPKHHLVCLVMAHAHIDFFSLGLPFRISHFVAHLIWRWRFGALPLSTISAPLWEWHCERHSGHPHISLARIQFYHPRASGASVRHKNQYNCHDGRSKGWGVFRGSRNCVCWRGC